ncbi:hypothetical protein ACFQ6U_02485 [Streptomyces sp. NPDC056465]|uniref:hypothetical protein n=1 Tax=unclassified Streptomyces TaxID=2593676 RepID=UPI0035E131B0
MTDHLDTVARGVPLVDDRLLLELANELRTADDLNRAASREGFFARLLGHATGHTRIRERNIRRASISAQQGTFQWLTSLTERMTVTDLVVAEVAEEVSEVKRQQAGIAAASLWSVERIDELGALVGRLARDAGHVLHDHDRRLAAVEAQLATDAAVRRWRWPRPDPGLPWLVRVVLLAREVAAGPAGEFAFTGDGRVPVRDDLVERMLQNPSARWYDGSKSLSGLLTAAVSDMPGIDHRRMIAELLGVGLEGELAETAGPLTKALADTAQRVATEEISPSRAAGDAMRNASGNGGRYLWTSLSIEQLLRRVVDEQFEEAAVRRARLRARRELREPSCD